MPHRFVLIAAAAALTGTVALAQSELIDGQVTKIDESAGKITIKHGPLKKFDMDEGMTMVFRAADPAMLKAVKAGDKVKFVPERVNGQFTVTRIEKAK
ncbi:copper-binding protein [Xanthobacteraceae bacterium Astr-EGSB]|uniref:copper-binding protein n=1 Tax=Astrobacterium formosum TaxID=3069710 RepID=UPI0027AFE4A5|nr:copper-binding protein [Xanthobacteraceae bacterium Astr-EGSB]